MDRIACSFCECVIIGDVTKHLYTCPENPDRLDISDFTTPQEPPC